MPKTFSDSAKCRPRKRRPFLCKILMRRAIRLPKLPSTAPLRAQEVGGSTSVISCRCDSVLVTTARRQTADAQVGWIGPAAAIEDDSTDFVLSEEKDRDEHHCGLTMEVLSSP
jgi:hypothetical protein